MSDVNRDEILKAAAHGNASALEFLRAFATRAHWVDDLCDRDTADSGRSEGALGMTVMGPSASKLAEMESEWLLTLSGNPFFLAHRAQLVPAMILALNAWVDSEAWPQPKDDICAGSTETRHRAQISVIKGQWHEVVWLVAWLTGGWQHLRATSIEFRSYDFEPQPQFTEADKPKCKACGNPAKFDVMAQLNDFTGYCSQMCRQHDLLGRGLNGLSR